MFARFRGHSFSPLIQRRLEYERGTAHTRDKENSHI
jgi:hypothetical protein